MTGFGVASYGFAPDDRSCAGCGASELQPCRCPPDVEFDAEGFFGLDPDFTDGVPAAEFVNQGWRDPEEETQP